MRSFLLCFCLLLSACATTARQKTLTPIVSSEIPTAQATQASTIISSPTPTLRATETLAPPPTITSTPDPFAPYYVESLRARTYGEGPVEIVETLERNSAFTRYLIAYSSDGLRITGMMNVPTGDGPFPVVVLNHGYYNPDRYVTGDGTQSAADNFARHGYLTLASDYREYGGSDSGSDPFRTGFAVDVLNLIASVKSLPQARADSIGIWGHSMGGGIAIEVLVVDPPGLRAGVLYGSMSGDMAENYYRIQDFIGGLPLGPEWPITPEEAPDVYARLSPNSYLEYVSAPVLIHHGELDDVVPPEWSARLAQELDEAGKEVTLYTYPAAEHSFFGEDWNTFIERNVNFFDRLLKQP